MRSGTIALISGHLSGKFMDSQTIRHEAQSATINLRRLDAVVLAVTAPVLLASTYFPPAPSGIALSLLLLPYIIRLVFGKPLSRPTDVNLPVGLLALGFLPLAFLMSPAPWGTSSARIMTLVWSIGLFFALVNWPNPGRAADLRTRFGGPTLAYLGLGALVALLGLLGMRSVDKLFFLPQTGILADYLGWESGLPTNEIAGVLTLFVPFVAALTYACLITGRRRQFMLLLLPFLLMVVTLVLTQSRTGLAATAAGTLLALLAADRVNRKWLIVGVIVAGAGLLLIGLTPVRDWFVFAGANSWNSVVGPRLGIWHQAIDAIRDQPLWGMGIGVFGPLARFIYPLIEPGAGPVLEDAHNLYLQTALDFGVAGLLVFLIIAGLVLAAAIRLTRARPPRTLSRLWAAGLLGALVAHALYSLTDAVSLGTLAGVPLWFAFGLVMGASRGRLQISWSNPARLAFGGAVVLTLAVSALALPVNRAGQLAAHALLDPSADAFAAAGSLDELSARNCRAGWYEGLVRHLMGDTTGRAAAWSDLVICSADYTDYMAVLAPSDAGLARVAIDAQPRSAAGYFWLAPALAADSPDEAIALFREGLRLAPDDGRRWLALAELLEPRDRAAALEAYLQACHNGDPGANGCLRAGSLAESQGDIATAIRYYRLSKWEGALDRAAELERQLVAGQP